MPNSKLTQLIPSWFLGLCMGLATYIIAFLIRLQEWDSWQETEFQLGNELLLATHDAYHWVAGAAGFEFGTGHPMAVLLQVLAWLTGYEPAQVAFWLPPIMGSLVALLVYAWAWSMGSMEAGFCAGILASLAPGFLARTLFGYADTDLVTLFLPLLIGLAPACLVMRHCCHPLAVFWMLLKKPIPLSMQAQYPLTLTPLWIISLALSGLLSDWAKDWHSLFPYLIRYNVALLGSITLILSNPNERKPALLLSLCYSLPTFLGPIGLIIPLMLLTAVIGKVQDFIDLLLRKRTLITLWLLTILLLIDPAIISLLLHHIQGYIKRSGDAVRSDNLDPLVFPSAAQSIIEIQDLKFSEILIYLHPWPIVASLGLLGFLIIITARSGALFLLPLALLAFLSMKLGGRMVMFGAPIMALGLTLPIDWLACNLGDVRANKFKRIFFLGLGLLSLIFFLNPLTPTYWPAFWQDLGNLRYIIIGCVLTMLYLGLGRYLGWHFTQKLDAIGPNFIYRFVAVLIVLLTIIPPLAILVPAMTDGPIINRRHADALRTMRNVTPDSATLWLWWDWGYAAHHFSRRKTIADGADHVGATLYLPALVFSTDSPHFARQVIKYTSLHDNSPKKVFNEFTGFKAASLMAKLKNPNTPLITGQGKQYIIVSFDMLDLGFWISTFGNWDFITKEGRGYAISIVPQKLAYRLDIGEVVMNSQTTIPAATIDIFADGQLIHKDYLSPPENAPENWQSTLDKRRNVHFLFNKVTGEKLVVDDRMYNTLMIQLLVRKPSDPQITPYFKLVYDNVFCRIYEVI